jgi:hypothetical protein
MRPLAIAVIALSACSTPDRKDDSRRSPPPAPEPPVPELAVPYIARGEHKSMMIDGDLSEMQWSQAAGIETFVEPGTGAAINPRSVNGDALLFWDDSALHVAITVKDRDVRGGFPADAVDPHLWERDTVEVMLDPDGDGDNRDYYEIQVNPQNLVFDSQFDGYNAPRTEPGGPFGHEAWQSAIKSGVVVHGTLDDPTDEDHGYTVEMAIPWASLSKAKVTPPRAGDTWRANFYAMEDNGGAAWSPILNKGNFHRASRFGRLRFDRR